MMSRYEQFAGAISGIYRSIQKIERDEMIKYGYKGAFAQYLAAMYRHPEGVTSVQLCEICDKDKAAVSRMVAEMEEKQLIKRVSENDNLYRAKLCLTEEGEKAAAYVCKRAAAAAAAGGKGLSEEDRQAFQVRVDKLLKYYSEIKPMPQVSDATYGEKGAQFIQGEAISDLGSLKCLLSIAKEQENFDYDTFFKQIAIIQKQARYEEAEKVYVDTDKHPIEAYRANIPLQNYDEFLNFYDIKEGDGMYLAPEDRIRVW